MLPCLSAKLEVYCTTDSAVDEVPRVDPGVDNQTRAGLERIGLAIDKTGVERIEQCGCRNLRRGVGRTRTGARRGRINRHALVDETHSGGGG